MQKKQNVSTQKLIILYNLISFYFLNRFSSMNISLDEIYFPKLIKFYQANLALSIILTTIILIPSIYIILTQSKNAHIFKYLLVNQLFWSYLFCVNIAILGFVPLLPLPALYYAGPIKFVDPKFYHVLIPIQLISGLCYGHSIFLAMLYRVTYSTTFSRLESIFGDLKKVLIVILVVLLIPPLIVTGKLDLFHKKTFFSTFYYRTVQPNLCDRNPN